jgi:hypothetical protein
MIVVSVTAAFVTACGGARDLPNPELAASVTTAFGGGVWRCWSSGGYSVAYKHPFNRQCDPSAGMALPFYVDGHAWCSVYRLSPSVPTCLPQ